MKLSALFFCILAVPLFGQNYPSHEDDAKLSRISVNGSVKFSNNVSLSRGYDSRELNSEPGFAAGIEYFVIRDEDEKKAGAGFEYNFKNKTYGIDGSFQNFPLYLFYDMSVMRIKYIALPNIHAQIGYNFLKLNEGFPGTDAKAAGGFYYAVGISTGILDHLFARILFSSAQGKLTFNDQSHLFSNNKISLTLLIR